MLQRSKPGYSSSLPHSELIKLGGDRQAMAMNEKHWDNVPIAEPVLPQGKVSTLPRVIRERISLTK